MFGLTTPSRLKAAGVVGMNRRNVELIAKNNPRKFFPRVDDKLLTKKLVADTDIAVPALLGVVKTQFHVEFSRR